MKTLPEPKKLELNRLEFEDFDRSPKSAKRVPDEILKKGLSKKAESYLSNAKLHREYRLQEKDVARSNASHTISSCLKVPSYAEKLFEGPYINDIPQPVADYIFDKIVGYNSYFGCLSD